MKRILTVLMSVASAGAAVGLVHSVATRGAVAQPVGASTAPARLADVFNRRAWCGTYTPTAAEAAAMERDLRSGPIRPIAPIGGDAPIGAAGKVSMGAKSVNAAGSTIVNIPVYFHVITAPGGVGNVSDFAIQEQIRALNEGFSGLHAPAGGTVPTRYRFVLKKIDRTVNANWYNNFYNIEDQPKFALRRGANEKPNGSPADYGTAMDLNIYTANLQVSGLLGYAVFPEWYHDDPFLDGVVLDAAMVQGVVSNPSDPYSNGRVGVHEVGHWMGLFHTFQDGCTTPNDYVYDTPAERAPKYNAKTDLPPTPGKTFPDTCPTPGRDPVEAYMDYSVADVLNKFTPGQVIRMNDHWMRYRDNYFNEPAPTAR